MNPAIPYLQSHIEYFWLWEEDGEIVSINGGNTITYTKPLFELMRKAKLKHLPPFGSLLAVLAVLGPDGANSKSQIHEFLKGNLLNKREDPAELKFLESVMDLPAELKQLSRVPILFRCLFEQTHGQLSEKITEQIMNALFGTARAPIESQELGSQMYAVGGRDMRALEILHRRFPSTNAIIKAMAGMVELEVLEEDLWPQDSPTAGEEVSFLEQLQQHSITFSSASLVQYLWAGLSIPWHFNHSGVQPLGGVADIANKGSFDRLLLSEFAHDDLTFMSRLANNEALYFSREVPPSPQKHQRILIIDLSLTNWGLIKTLSFSAALALINHPQSDCEYEVYAVGEHYRKLDLSNLESVIAAVQHVELCMHSGNGLALLCQDVLMDKAEVFYIGGQASLKESGMAKVIAENRKSFHYWVHPDADGQISIYQNKPKDRKHIKNILVPYEQLWKQNKLKSKPSKKHVNRSGQLQLLLPMLPRAELVMHVQNDNYNHLFLVTKEGALLKKYDDGVTSDKKGWQLITPKLGLSGRFFAFAKRKTGEHVLLNYDSIKKVVTEMNLTTLKKEDFLKDLTGIKRHEDIVFYDEKFYLLPTDSNRVMEINEVVFRVKDEKISKKVRELKAALVEKRNEKKNRELKSFSILKKVDQVFISDDHFLVLNSHQLLLNPDGHLKLKTTPKGTPLLTAEIVDDHFQFQDGSSVKIYPYGVMELVSSDLKIPPIFIPTVLGRTLGMSAGADFAGNEFYYSEGMTQLKLLDAGNMKLDLVKRIKQMSRAGLKECKEAVDNAPALLPEMTSLKAEAFLKDVEEMQGVKVEVLQKMPHLNIIRTQQFYLEYIQAFIRQIISQCC